MSEAARALDAIRVAELEAARCLEEARTEAAEAIVSARRQAAQAVSDGKRRGRDEAQRRFQAVIAAAEDQARSILAGCEAREEDLQRAAAPHREAAVAAMVDLLLAPPLEEGK